MRPECSRILRQPPLSRPSLKSCAKGRKLLNKQNSRRHFYSEYWRPSNFPIEANPAGGAPDPCDGVRGVQRRHPQEENATNRSALASGPCGRASAPEQGARRETVLRHEFGRGYFLAVFVLCLEDLDSSSLSGHEEARGADFGNLSDLAFYRAECAEQMFAAVEDLQFLAAQRGPGAGGGVAAAYQVVSEFDMRGPVDFRFGGAAPALVARAALVLHRLAVLARHHQVGRFEHRSDPHREQAIEIDAAERVVRIQRRFLLQDDRPLVETIVGPENGEPCTRVAADNRPVDRAGAPVFRQERRVVLDRALLRNLHEFLRRELQYVGHDADVGIQCAQRIVRILVPQRGKLVDLDALLLRGDLQEICLGAFFFRGAEHARDFVSARQECIEHGFAEVLLADDRYFHGYAAFFGGTEKAPACFRPAIFASS